MRCHYEVLSVNQKASSDTIKKAYRKLALKYHPDKNVGVDVSTHFREVQDAYETLSNDRERKWYDDHRDEILREFDDEDWDVDDYVVDLFSYFTTSCFDGFGTDKMGFYNVYREAFLDVDDMERDSGVHTEEAKKRRRRRGKKNRWRRWKNKKGQSVEGPSFSEEEMKREAFESDVPAAPPFGDANSPWEEVNAFYSHWAAFASTLTFSWCDEYDVREAGDRRVRRAIENENNKSRRVGRKEYSDRVVNLVEFVRRRDPRVRRRQEENEKQKKVREQEKVKAEKERREEVKKARDNFGETLEATDLDRIRKEEEARNARIVDLNDDYNFEAEKLPELLSPIQIGPQKAEELYLYSVRNKRKFKKWKDMSDVDKAKWLEMEKSEAEKWEAEQAAKIAAASEHSDVATAPPPITSTEPPLPPQFSTETDQCIVVPPPAPSIVDSLYMSDNDSGSSSSSETEEVVVIYKCELCNKTFKSDAQFENHCKSKKHKDKEKKASPKRKPKK
ncbi:hypothetical protein TrST_g13465 [Triparma strigata]|uniref:Uncharacterized protein n=1 Tax=Triparma strigata TaxID=1606541 RepID=A0A9W7C3E9_9STRA|nr:hypothetical protein TrST_g13465 [Triparma strigata]